jgi:hypothetical protein
MLPLKYVMFETETPCSSENVQRFGGTHHLHFQGQSFLILLIS